MFRNLSGRLGRRDFLKAVTVSATCLAATRTLRAFSAETSTAGPRPSAQPVRIGVVGGGFGSHFQWHLHPQSKVTAVCDLRDDRLQRLQQAYKCGNLYRNFHQFLKHPELDAVAIFTPPHLHVSMAAEAMKAGKHVISAVPAGLSVGELEELLATVKRTGVKYMMAETSRFRPEILTCVEWARQGKFGTIFYSEAEYHHPGDIEYCYGDSFDCQSCHLERYEAGTFRREQAVPTWSCIPPMLYPTHCTGLIVPVTGERFVEVVAVGWGDSHEMLKDNYYKNPFWNSQAFFKTSGGHSARVSVWWHAAAGHGERGSFYGDKMSYVMKRPEGSPNAVIRQQARPVSQHGVYDSDIKIEAYDQPAQLEKLPESLRIESGHGGSHTFITHEFIRAIVEDRHPAVNVWEAIAYTLPGIVAHQSAIQGGTLLKIKDYGRAPGT